MKKEFDQIQYQNSWIKENNATVKASFKKEFVQEFKEACKALNKSQSSVIRDAMEETIKKSKKEGK